MIKLKHFSKSVIGLVRKANEDSIGSLTNEETNGNGDIFVVCDGMGGHVGGAIASQTAVKYILQYFKNPHPNPIVALEKAVSLANDQIIELSQKDPDLKGMGTTCTVLLTQKEKIFIAHVGDSRIYINTENKLYRLTKDHSFVQQLVDAGQLKDSEMESHPRKNELTTALGVDFNVVVEVAENPILPKKGDKFLMCSDGLCGLVNDLTILNTINKTNGIKTVNDLIQLAENAGGNDNISVGIIEIIESPHSKTIFKDKTNKKSSKITQVLDVNSMKGDKIIAFFKKNLFYILSFLIIGIGILGFIILNGSSGTNGADEPIKTNPTILETELDQCDKLGELLEDPQFKNKKEGDLFRKWIIKYHGSIAFSLDIDPEGGYQYSGLKEAWIYMEDDGETLGCKYLNRDKSKDADLLNEVLEKKSTISTKKENNNEMGNTVTTIFGCMDGGDTEDGDGIIACNYDPSATEDDDSCKYEDLPNCEQCVDGKVKVIGDGKMIKYYIDKDEDGFGDLNGKTLPLCDKDEQKFTDEGVMWTQDSSDNCPEKFNENQKNSDNDTLGDACDNCPDVSNENQKNSDNDTYGDACDNCPDVSNENQKNSDNDTLGDDCDNCPDDSNEDQADRDEDGLGDECDKCPDDNTNTCP